MLMFLGDSHSRQFQSDLPGNWAYVSFSGATIKGLLSPSSNTGHAEAIKSLAASGTYKKVFLMFGGVDLDVTFYRNLAMGRILDEEGFYEERAEIYSTYLDKLAWAGGKYIQSINILAPQITPLKDHVFDYATAKMANLPQPSFSKVHDILDCSHAARCRRQIRFNAVLNDKFANTQVSVHRICHLMAGHDGLIQDRFINPKLPRDHHAHAAKTLPLWQTVLKEVVPAYRKIVRRRIAKLGDKLITAFGVSFASLTAGTSLFDGIAGLLA